MPRRPILAFVYSIPIAIAGGLIGLGGAEFRLPVLLGPLGYAARAAVPLNLAVSLVTLATSFVIRGRSIPLDSLGPYFHGIEAMICGAVLAAWFGTALAHKVSDVALNKIIWVLLAIIGIGLIAEGFLPERIPALLPATATAHIVGGFIFGLAIGLVSSLLGVAGGELIIPTLVFAYGADIKIAGSASLLISLPTVLVGVSRYAWRGAYKDSAVWKETIFPMSVGSVIGAILGGLLVGFVPPNYLKVGLGTILLWSAYKIFKKSRKTLNSLAPNGNSTLRGH